MFPHRPEQNARAERPLPNIESSHKLLGFHNEGAATRAAPSLMINPRLHHAVESARQSASDPKTGIDLETKLETKGKPALHRQRIPVGKLPLMPVGIDGRHCAGLVQLGHLLRGQIPPHRGQILPQLLFIARADNDR